MTVKLIDIVEVFTNFHVVLRINIIIVIIIVITMMIIIISISSTVRAIMIMFSIIIMYYYDYQEVAQVSHRKKNVWSGVRA